MNTPLLTMNGISKSFSGVTVLDHVTLNIFEGEIQALMGANGAGKSTLMKVLTGIYQKDGGQIKMKDAAGNMQEIDISSPKQALSLGISMVYQELNLLNNLSIAENIYLGREPLTPLGTVDWKRLMAQSKEILQEVNLDLDPATKVESLSLAQKQTVEIAKCLSFRSRIIIMDEPTTSLTERETEVLFRLLNELKRKGVSVIYISHRMEEIFRISDRITVYRDGRFIASLPASETNNDEVIRMMVGRSLKIERKQGDQSSEVKPVTLKVENLSARKLLRNISFELKQGEIIGMFGLAGAGRTELARAIFGIDPISSGTIKMDGETVRIRFPGDAINKRIALVPEDRKQDGLILGLSISKNMILTKLKQLRSVFWSNHFEKEVSEKYIRDLSVACVGPDQPIHELSGGNQQKVIIGKWLSMAPKVLILDEPTRGIDIGAKTEIYNLMEKLASEGMSILMISSELSEILNISHRTIIMHEGSITLDAPTNGLNQETIMRAAVGGK